MNSSLILPTEPQFIAEVGLKETTLTVRLKPEALSVATASAFVLSAAGVLDAAETYEALDALRAEDDYVYLFTRDHDVVVSSEGGYEVILRASSFSGRAHELTAEEFREALAYFEKLYGDAHQYGNHVQSKLQRVRDLLQEQDRRIAIKGESHPPGSAAAILYGQHARFLQRLLRELDA